MTALSSSGPSRAPWRNIIDSHLSQTPNYEFTIGTIGRDDQNRPVPRVRTCGFRGFFPELTLHPSGEKDMEQQVKEGGNPSVYESDMLTFTTDVRMEKLGQLESSQREIEAVFWLKDLMAQWRVKGKAFAIGNPLGEADKEDKLACSAVQKGLRVKDGGAAGVEGWTWERAVTKYFANHSPIMRGRLVESAGLLFAAYRGTMASLSCSLVVHADLGTRLFQKPATWSAQIARIGRSTFEDRAESHRFT
jgi:hypothetical protein